MSGRTSHRKTTAAKRLMSFNALNSSRPRTEEGQPVLYSQIKSRLRYRNDEDFEVSLRRSVRSISDPDLPGCLVHGDEEFFKNSVKDHCARQESLESTENLDVSQEFSNKNLRRSVRDVIHRYEGLSVENVECSRTSSVNIEDEHPLPMPKPRSQSDFMPVKRKPVPAPRKKSNTKSISPYHVVDLIKRSEESTKSDKENSASVMARLSKISSTSSIESKEKVNGKDDKGISPSEYDEVEQDLQSVSNDVFVTTKVNGQNDNVDGDITNNIPTALDVLNPSTSSNNIIDQLSPLPEKAQTVTSPVLRSRFISDPTPLDITVYRSHSIDQDDGRPRPTSHIHKSDCRHSTVSNNSWYSEGCGWDSDEFENSEDETSLLDSSKEDTQDEKAATDKKIFNIVNEILTTERTYVKRLHLLDKVYYDRLLTESKKSGASFPDKIVNDIFSKLSPISEFHTQILLPDLESRMTSWSTNAKIGDIFRTLGHCLKLYSHYVANFDNATKLVNSAIKKYPKFCSIVDEIQRTAESESLSLQHHMLGPIQRVPRYKLLLTDYLKRLPEDSADRCEAEESLVVISKAAAHANDSMKHMDKFKKLLELQDRITEGLHGETLVTASRVFIKEGDVSKIAARSDHRMPRTLLLFNDLLLCCGKTGAGGSKLKVKQIMDMDGMKLMDENEVDFTVKHAFRVRSRQRVLDLAASNNQDKEDWIECISGAISDYVEIRGPTKNLLDEELVGLEKSNSLQIGLIAPVWVKDDDVSMCMLCASRFWLANRRHHCRGCGRACCENCSKYKVPLPYANHAFKRVCFSCYKKISNENANQPSQSKDISTLKKDRRRRNSNIPAFISGELLCKQPNKGWSRDWFALLPDFVLYVHRKKQDVKAVLTLPIPGWTVEQGAQGSDLDSDGNNTFKIFHPNLKESTYYFEADDKETKDRWLEALSYASKAEIPPSSVIVDEFRADL